MKKSSEQNCTPPGPSKLAQAVKGDEHHRRATCSRCKRPERVCICHALPSNPLPTLTRVLILQTRAEAKTKIKTADLIPLCLENSKLIVGGSELDWGIPPDAVLLFPGENAKPLNSLVKTNNTIIVLDGTWDGARRLLSRSQTLQSLPRAYIPEPYISTSLFKARKAPSTSINGARSTAEAVASALECIEGEASLTSVQALRAAVHEMSESQLRFIREKGQNGGKHRKERKGYVDNLYKNENGDD